MNKSELKSRIAALLSRGTGRSEVFDQLSNQGVKGSTLATLIASYATPLLCKQHQVKVWIAIALMVVQSLLIMAIGLVVATDTVVPTSFIWAITGLVAMVPLLFAWGFYKNHLGAYNAFLIFSCIQAPRALEDFASGPIGSSVALVISALLIGFVGYVRYKIFPDIVLLGPRKLKGRYQFST